MKEDKLRGLKFVIIFLSGIVILLIGYIVNDVFFTMDNCILEGESSKLLDLNNFSNYKNYDGTYASMKHLRFNSEDGLVYSINLGMDGKVYSGDYSLRKDITNVSDAIDIVSVEGGTGFIEDSSCYILTDDGDVYVYYMYDMMTGVYEATLVENVSNVDRLIEFHYVTMENAGSSWGVIAVLEDGSSIKLVEVTG